VGPSRAVFAQGDASLACYIMTSGSISVWIKSPAFIAAEQKRAADLAAAIARAAGKKPVVASAAAAAAAAASAATAAATDGSAADATTSAHVGVGKPEADIEEAAQMTEEDAAEAERLAALALADANANARPALRGAELRRTLGDCIGRMAAGSERGSFGELGLLEGRMRSASILAETRLQCLVIRRKAFEATIKAVYRAEFDLKLKTLRAFSPLRTASEAFLCAF
jgi:CRP-like cAMP-binding protein